nr:DUF6850 family outer membrane beta-barrel protein [uncultured Draconibacterium sp.]
MHIRWLLLFGGIFFSTQLVAQESVNWANFNYIKASNGWLTSENAAGLDKLSVDKISFIEATFNKQNGDFINYFQSDNSYSFGASTESFYRINKLVFYGQMQYTDFSGKNMGGSTLFNPGFSPFDIVEFADSTAGTKNMEQYYLTGALSIPVNNNLTLGLKTNYYTASYYKTKDLRHTNDIMNLETTLGLSYSFNSLVDVGMNYYFRKRTENTSYQSEGNTDQQFNSLISYGSFFGLQENFGNEGMTGSTDNNPLVDFIHGVSFQLELFAGNNFNIFNDLGFKWRNGYFGQKSSVDIQYTEHQANIISYKGVISLNRNRTLHQLSINFDYEDLINLEKSYSKSTDEGGNTTILYFGKNQVLDRVHSKASFLYSGNINVNDNNPEWLINAGISIWRRDQLTVTYPFYRRQDIQQFLATASLKKNIFSNSNMFSFSVGAQYGSGTGTDKEDGQFANALKNYATLDNILYREYEFLTTRRASGNAAFRYTKAFPANFKIYGGVGFDYTKAFDVSYSGNTYRKVALNIGYIF